MASRPQYPDIRQLASGNAIKDMLSDDDNKFIAAVDIAINTNSTVPNRSAVKQPIYPKSANDWIGLGRAVSPPDYVGPATKESVIPGGWPSSGFNPDSTRVGWPIDMLRKRQTMLTTYSSDVAQLLRVIESTISRATNTIYMAEDIIGAVNFGAKPTELNSREISVLIYAPVKCTISIRQSLELGKIVYDAAVYDFGAPNGEWARTEIGQPVTPSIVPGAPSQDSSMLIVYDRTIEL